MDKLHTVVLGTGDGDFTPLVRLLQSWKLSVEAVAFAPRSNRELQQEVDVFHPMSEEDTLT